MKSTDAYSYTLPGLVTATSASFIDTSKQKGEKCNHTAYFVDITAVANGGPEKFLSVHDLLSYNSLLEFSLCFRTDRTGFRIQINCLWFRTILNFGGIWSS